MTAQQINHIKASWRLLVQVDPLLVGGLFYDKLFALAPQVRHMFKGSQEDEAKMLIEMLNILVMRL